ncbi:MAG: SseB family protein, partial [Chloroflexi bacterium]|nr:SseB family protein [Chloroflexota bacterium]
ADVTKCQPVFTDPTNGRPAASVSFNPGLNRYIMTVPHGGVGKLGVFDAPEPWGPWTTIAYYDNWGGFGNSDSLYYYFPTKWISADGKTMWMVFSSTNELDAFNLVRADLIPKLLPFKQYAPVVITAQ